MIGVRLQGEQRADSATVAVLRKLLEAIEANLDGAIADPDGEFLHDLRVSVRRSRAVQRQLAGVFPREELARFRRDFRWLQQATGEARDLDVHVLQFEAMRSLVPERLRADLAPLFDVLRGRRLAARRQMSSALRSERTTSLLREWSWFVERLQSLPTEERSDATRAIRPLAGERIRKLYRRMVRMGRAIDEASAARDYHQLRKQGKELRYLLELFGAPLYPQSIVKPMTKSLKALQDVLGRHQDREVQIAMLGAVRDELAGVQGGPGALIATGALVQRLEEDELQARAAFAERFAKFASKAERKRVNATFA